MQTYHERYERIESDGKITTICTLELPSGFTIYGESSCDSDSYELSHENEKSKKDALNKIAEYL